MKKNYMKPDMRIVELKNRQMLLAGSAIGTDVKRGSSGYWADEDDETL